MDNKVKITVARGESVKMKKGITLSKIAESYKATCKYPIIAAKVNNELWELHRPVTRDSEIDFLDIADPNGFRVYQRSAAFLLVYAAKEVLGRKADVYIKHSINKNFYCEILDNGTEISQISLEKIEKKMLETIEKNLPIEKISLSMDDAIDLANEFGLRDKVQFLQYRRTSTVNFYKLDWFYNYFYGHMAVSTGVINNFRLVKQKKGFILQIPSSSNPDQLSEIKNLAKISKVFIESGKWAKILKADTVGALNEIICSGKAGEFIRTNEGLHEKKIAKLADKIHEDHKKIVLISGPSSSGKTTFAERLSVQLRVNGLKANIISLDNYYLDRDVIPLDEFGQKDFETIHALDIAQINEDFTQLLKGKKVDIPAYNFHTGKREYKGRSLKIDDNSILVVEGIHGLNEKLTENIPKDFKFKIFISALTQLNIDDHNRIPTTDTRLIRRIVRDSQFRGFNAIKTLGVWASVQRGEEKYIFPFQEEADALFNSALVYELCVLKQYAEPLLLAIDKNLPEYSQARRLIKFLDCFISIPNDEIPNNSILREFIGGGCFRI